MENKNLQLIDLTVEEIIYLSSFVRTIKHYGIDGSIYHYGTYGEQQVCITKSDINVWEVYIGERGNIFDKSTYESCFDACIELLKYGADTKEEDSKLINHYKKEVEYMKNSLKQIEEKEFIPQITNPLLEIKKTKK
jgi:hypothetical protein